MQFKLIRLRLKDKKYCRFRKGMQTMRRLFWLMLVLLWLVSARTSAQQDALNLPSELLVLRNDGGLERYGLGAAGVAQIPLPDADVVDFGLAPDGVTLAYRTQNALKLHNLLSGFTREVEGVSASFPPYRGRGQTVVWSPDGLTLAYTTDYGLRFYFPELNQFTDVTTTPAVHLVWSDDSTYLAVESENNIWWVYRRDNNAMVLHAAIPDSLGAAWVDANVLMFAPSTGGLYLMDVANANAQAQIGRIDTQYKLPVLRPDRSVALLTRRLTDSSVPATGGALTVAVFDAQTGWTVEPLSQTAFDAEGMRWSPEGALLVKLSGGVLALVDAASGQGFNLPTSGIVAYSWAVQRRASVESLPLSADAFFLTRDYTGFQQVWQLPASGQPPQPVTAAESDLSAFDVASDGRTVLYVTGGNLYFLPADSDMPRMLVESGAVGAVDLKADGSAAVYEADGKIYRISTAADSVPQELLSGYDSPRYFGRDEMRLLVRLPDGDLGLYDFTTRDVFRLGAYRDALALADGTLIAVGKPAADDIEGVYVVDISGAAPPLLLYGVAGERIATQVVTVASGTVRVLVSGAGFVPMKAEVVDIAVNRGPIGLNSVGFMAQARLSGDGRFITGMANAFGVLAVRDLTSGREALYPLASQALAIVWLR